MCVELSRVEVVKSEAYFNVTEKYVGSGYNVDMYICLVYEMLMGFPG